MNSRLPPEQHDALRGAAGGEHGEFGEGVRRRVQPAEHLAGEDIALLADLAVAVQYAGKRRHHHEHEEDHVRLREIPVREGRAVRRHEEHEQHHGRLQNEGEQGAGA